MIDLSIGANIKSSSIFIVDDNLQNIILLENLLNLAGYENIWSTTLPEELLEKLKESTPDLLLLDLMMPKISGFDVLHELKKEPYASIYLPVVVITADSNPESRERALSLGASDFLTKPFDMNEIRLRIKNILTTKYLMDQLQNSNANLEELVKIRTQELEKSKEEAERNEKKFKLLFESNLDPIRLFYINDEGPSKFIEFNHATEVISGYSKEEYMNLSIWETDSNMDEEYFKEKFAELKKEGSLTFETTMLRKDGSARTVEMKAILLDLDGRPAVMDISRDITERVRHVETLTKQNEILKEIAWTQSHVVRAPLARMMGIIMLMKDSDLPNCSPETAEFLNLILKSAFELDEVIRDISKKSNDSQALLNKSN